MQNDRRIQRVAGSVILVMVISTPLLSGQRAHAQQTVYRSHCGGGPAVYGSAHYETSRAACDALVAYFNEIAPWVTTKLSYFSYRRRSNSPLALPSGRCFYAFYAHNGRFMYRNYRECPVAVTGQCGLDQRIDATNGQCIDVAPPRDRKALGRSCGDPAAAAWFGNPCNAATGNKYQAEVDYRSAVEGLSYVRHYNSLGAVDIGLGVGWTSSFYRRLEFDGPYIVAHGADGRGEPFSRSEGGWQGDADTHLDLLEDASGFTLRGRGGESERYDSTGRIVTAIDAAGNETHYVYDDNGRLAGVTNAYGHRLSFAHDSHGRLAQLIDAAGNAYTYGYDGDRLVEVIYPDGGRRAYHYEDPLYAHLLTGISDETGTRIASFSYDETGRAVVTEHAQTSNDSAQRRYALSYESTDRATLIGPQGVVEHLSFDEHLGVRRLQSRVFAHDGKGITQRFDESNNLIEYVDAEGRATRFVYGPSNQLLSRVEAAGSADERSIVYEYLNEQLDLPTRIAMPSVLAGANSEIRLTYDERLNPVAVTHSGFRPDGTAVSRTLSLLYDDRGRPVRIDGPREDVADVVTLRYRDCDTGFGCGRLESVSDASGNVTTFDAYDADGRLLGLTHPSGLAVAYEYDLRGRVTAVTQRAPTGAERRTAYAYDAAGRLQVVSGTHGAELYYDHDAAGDLRRVGDALGEVVEHDYDASGGLVATRVRNADGSLARRVERAYDPRRRPRLVDRGGSVTEWMHDAAGALLARYDANGNAASTFVYDALGRLLGHTDALGQTSEFRRDEGDRPVEVVAPNGALTRYVYDDIGNLLLEQGPDRGTLKFSHDASGNIVSIEEADGVIVSYRYDALNRLAGIDYPGEEEDVRFVYDACNNGAGRLCEVRDFSGTTRYVYDPFGRVVEQTKQELGVVYRTAYEYDAHDRVTVLHYPDGHRLERLRDAVGRVHTVLHTAPASEPTMPHRATDQAPAAETIVAGRRYRADGLLTAQVYGNGLSEWRAYDLQGRPVDYALGSLAHQRYVHDPNGNPLVIDGGTRSSRYAYDGVDRLVAEYHEAVDAAGAEVIEYDYDANGNRRGRAGDGEFTHYDFEPQSNRLTAVNGAARVRDAGGRLLNDTAAVLEFVYDNAGRVAALYRGGALAARYVYDAFGRRTRKTTPAGTVVYHYDLRGRLIQETGADGSRRRTYFWDDDVPLAQLAPPRDPRPLPATGADAPGEAHHAAGGAQTVADARPEYPESARWPETRTVAALTYLHTDHLGTPRLGTDADGALAWRWRGDAFGEAGPEVERALVNLRFPGQYFDAESGLHYNREVLT